MAGVEAVLERVEELVAEGERGLAFAMARRLAHRMSVVDRSLVPQVVKTFVQECDDATLLATLNMLSVRARTGDRLFRYGAQELATHSDFLRESLDYDRLMDLYAAASAAGLSEVTPLFYSRKHDPRGMTVDEAAPENVALELPLGTRKAMARKRDRDTIDRVMRDKNAEVIAILLDNPRLTERDVVHIAAMRPTRGEVLEKVAHHRKWATRYPVRKALSANPYTPHPIAARLMGTLMVQDLRFIAGTSVLPDHVRDVARRILDEMKARGEEPAAVPEVWELPEG